MGSKTIEIGLINIYTVATKIAMANNQTVGEKNDYYVTLEQLMRIVEDAQRII